MSAFLRVVKIRSFSMGSKQCGSIRNITRSKGGEYLATYHQPSLTLEREYSTTFLNSSLDTVGIVV